jgi:hypothetical protein
MPIYTNTRPLKGGLWYQHAQWTLDGVPQATERVDHDIDGTQTTTTYRSHPRDGGVEEYNRMTGEELAQHIPVEYQTRFDNGHEFFTQQSGFSTYHTMVRLTNPSYFNPRTGRTATLEYFGPLRPQGFQIPTYPDIAPYKPSNSQLDALGSKLVGRVAPTASEAAVSVFLGELRADGLPKIPAIHLYRLKSLSALAQRLPEKGGDEYLNWQFGVKPFKNDLQQMAQAVLTAVKRMKQLRRDTDKVVRRKGSLGETVFTIDQGFDTGGSGFWGLPRMNLSTPPPMFSNQPSMRVIDTVKQHVYFSGAFTYHLTEATSFLGKLDAYAEKANHLLGTEIDLETIWNLTRWSWLVDWFFDVGGFLHNVDLFHQDNLVMRYGYVMATTSITRDRSVLGIVPIGSCTTTGITSQAIIMAKQRKRATPYGFGVNMSALSDSRWAILGSLGLTRAPKVLKLFE